MHMYIWPSNQCMQGGEVSQLPVAYYLRPPAPLLYIRRKDAVRTLQVRALARAPAYNLYPHPLTIVQ